MSGFSGRFLEIQPRELVRYLLHAAGQCEREFINPSDLLDLLELKYESFNFQLELPDEAKETVGGGKPRALISFADRLVATDSSLSENKARFSLLHEIGHYVLPKHQNALFVCDDQGLSLSTRLVLEKQASEFAADLLFLGDRFSLEANSRPVSAMTVKQLATKYRASFEATARRLVERSFQACMLIVFKQESAQSRIDVSQSPIWSVKYCIASPSFKTQYVAEVEGIAPPDVVTIVAQPGHDVADSYSCEVSLTLPTEPVGKPFLAEFFYNQYNIFCLLRPTPPTA
jgi:hypothetical protein